MAASASYRLAAPRHRPSHLSSSLRNFYGAFLSLPSLHTRASAQLLVGFWPDAAPSFFSWLPLHVPLCEPIKIARHSRVEGFPTLDRQLWDFNQKTTSSTCGPQNIAGTQFVSFVSSAPFSIITLLYSRRYYSYFCYKSR